MLTVSWLLLKCKYIFISWLLLKYVLKNMWDHVKDEYQSSITNSAKKIIITTKRYTIALLHKIYIYILLNNKNGKNQIGIF